MPVPLPKALHTVTAWNTCHYPLDLGHYVLTEVCNFAQVPSLVRPAIALQLLDPGSCPPGYKCSVWNARILEPIRGFTQPRLQSTCSWQKWY